jgi:peroxiredoxin
MTNAPTLGSLTLGSPAPDFSLPTDGGGHIALSDLSGRWAVIYFYPKDNTPGCTSQAIAFTDHIKAFHACGAQIVGISRDSVKKHDNFKAKHDLKITLASDEGGDMTEAYGVWQEKKNYGKTYMGIVRSTFLVNPEGKIAHIWPKVRVKGHVETVLETLQSLTSL